MFFESFWFLNPNFLILDFSTLASEYVGIRQLGMMHLLLSWIFILFFGFWFYCRREEAYAFRAQDWIGEAESLVWHCFSSISSYVSEWLLSFWGLGFELMHDWLFPIWFGTMTRDLKVQWCGCLDLENGPWHTHNLPPTQKATLLAKLQEYKSDLNNLKQDFKKVSMAHDPVASRDELMESRMADHVMVCNIHFGTSCIFVETLAIAHHT